jgi:hypothetical protein
MYSVVENVGDEDKLLVVVIHYGLEVMILGLKLWFLL